MQNKAEKIVLVETNKLKPYHKNRNKHSKEQIDRLVEIIKYQGNRVPIIVDQETMEVIAGNGRLEAYKKMNVQEVPCILQKFDSEEQRYAFMVSDNALANWAELDLSAIHTDIQELDPTLLNIDMLGIKDFRFEPLFQEPEPKNDPTEKEAALKSCPNCGVFFG